MKDKNLSFRDYMELSIEVMKESVHEFRKDKTSPMVGAVLVRPDGSYQTVYRGEMREGDHAEYTLIDRKNRAERLDGSLLFVTLEPCAPGARTFPKLSCSERIANARIKKIWIGIEDPDPKVDRKGIKYLEEQGVEVEMFGADLQKQIREINKQFIIEAKERAKQAIGKEEDAVLTAKENIEIKSELADLSDSVIEEFLKLANLKTAIGSEEFTRVFS
jgi:ATP-dependent DNA helicase RecG